MAHASLSRIGELAEKLQQAPCEPPRDLQGDLEALKRMARRIRAVLNDAEKREIQEESVGLWLKELKGVAYDAEDMLDVYDSKLLRAKVEAGIQLPDDAAHRLPYKLKHQEVSPSAVTSISLDTSFCGKIAEKIGQIRGRFEEISKQRDDLYLREGDGERKFQSTIDLPPSSHFVDAPTIYGRGDDLERVISRLLCSDECKKGDLLVLPIVGMGGVGKTTLVQHVYNDQRVLSHFQVMGWVCVSDDFTVEKLTARIIESITKDKCHLEEFSVLQNRLKELLGGKLFLLVLDDVWNEKPRLWESLQKPLRFGVQGSAVMATTRHDSVAKIMQTVPFHRLNCLSVDDCYAVFIKSAFAGRDAEEHPDLIEIGKKIVRKCGGLPLAAKSLGGLLRHENEVDEWEEVLQSDVWDLRDQGDGIIPPLRLSYLHLPSYLKQCFLYASIFPKDFGFTERDLIPHWMAHGFLQFKGHRQAEDVGSTYFDELVQRSLFQWLPNSVYIDGTQCFVMHDLIHDLAQHLSEGEIFCADNAQGSYPSEVRHVSMHRGKTEEHANMSHFLSNHATRAIRTVMVRDTWNYLSWNLLDQMMSHSEFLRVLDLRHSQINELPDSVGNLKLLRHLDLSGSMIPRLPDSICKLYNLRTLYLTNCYLLRSLPKDVTALSNLQYVDIQHTKLDFLPSGFGKLTGLRGLAGYMVGVRSPGWPNSSLPQASNVECSLFEELNDLSHLEGTLEIFDLSHVMDAKDARLADLSSKRNVRELLLNWTAGKPQDKEGLGNIASPGAQMEVLDNLRPPDRLQVLKIDGFGGMRFPSWMVDDPSSFSKLVRVKLYNCHGCTFLPPLGQLPSLKHLEIRGMNMIESVSAEFSGHASVGFPALEELHFSHISKWVTWELAGERGDFPRLRHLSVSDCPKLESIVPLYLLPALQEVGICDCPLLMTIELWGAPSSSFKSSCSSTSSTSMGPPSLIKMFIYDCPRARFSPVDDDQQPLPLPLPLSLSTLRDFLDIHFVKCPLLVEWCERGGSNWLAHIPTAKIWKTRDGDKIVSTCEPEEYWSGKGKGISPDFYSGSGTTFFPIELMMESKEQRGGETLNHSTA